MAENNLKQFRDFESDSDDSDADTRHFDTRVVKMDEEDYEPKSSESGNVCYLCIG